MSFDKVRFTTLSEMDRFDKESSINDKLCFIDQVLSGKAGAKTAENKIQKKRILDVFVAPEYTFSHRMPDEDLGTGLFLFPYAPISHKQKKKLYEDMKILSKKYPSSVIVLPVLYEKEGFTYNVTTVLYNGKPILKQFKRIDDYNPMGELDRNGKRFSSPHGEFKTKDIATKKGVPRNSAFFDIGDIRFGLKNCIDEALVPMRTSMEAEGSRKPDFQITVSAGSVPNPDGACAGKGYVTADHCHPSSATDLRTADLPSEVRPDIETDRPANDMLGAIRRFSFDIGDAWRDEDLAAPHTP